MTIILHELPVKAAANPSLALSPALGKISPRPTCHKVRPYGFYNIFFDAGH